MKIDPPIQLVLVFGSCNIVRAVINFYEVNITTIATTANLNPPKEFLFDKVKENLKKVFVQVKPHLKTSENPFHFEYCEHFSLS